MQAHGHATYDLSCRRSGRGQLRRLTYASYSELQEQSSEQRCWQAVREQRKLRQ